MVKYRKYQLGTKLRLEILMDYINENEFLVVEIHDNFKPNNGFTQDQLEKLSKEIDLHEFRELFGKYNFGKPYRRVPPIPLNSSL